MQTSAYGRAQITQREGKRLRAYHDSVGIMTIGVGHTSAAGPPMVTEGMAITDAECDEILSRDLAKFEKTVNECVKVPLAQNEFDALVSFCFNIGQPGFARSHVVSYLNDGDRKAAADSFMMWNKPPEIIGRRKTEMVQFLTPYKTAPAPVAPTPIPPPVAPKVIVPPTPTPPDVPAPKPVAPAPTPAPQSNWLVTLLRAFFGRG